MLLLLLTGTYFARDASYAHEYTDVRLTTDNTSSLQPAAAAAAAGAVVLDDSDAQDNDAEKRADNDSKAALSADSTIESCWTRLRLMVAARVYVGRYTAGHRTYRKPPPLDPGAEPLSTMTYDSCVNYVDDPTLFVVFDSSQCYPEHFITYAVDQ